MLLLQVTDTICIFPAVREITPLMKKIRKRIFLNELGNVQMVYRQHLFLIIYRN